MGAADKIAELYRELPPGVRVVAVSKTRTPDEIMELYSSGYKIIGENKVQEMVAKSGVLPGDIEWHMVGHLQTNKVKYIAPFVTLIHSVDSAKLIKTISKEAIRHNRIIDCLFQVHIAEEETKFGFSPDELTDFLKDTSSEDFPGVRIRGLMGMATYTDNSPAVKSEFRRLARLFSDISNTFPFLTPGFDELSMGMSGDYRIAVEEGSTIVRIGSLIFD